VSKSKFAKTHHYFITITSNDCELSASRVAEVIGQQTALHTRGTKVGDLLAENMALKNQVMALQAALDKETVQRAAQREKRERTTLLRLRKKYPD
jgi:hypothetical protein